MLKRSFLFNVLLIALISFGLLYLFFNSLNWLTNHGKQTTVPSLMGKKMSAAVKELKAMGFRITIDSTYLPDKDPMEVLFQEPESGTSVKIGRTIFLTVNKKTPPSIEMPNLVNMSFRNALLTMHSYNLEMGDTNYRPDVAAGAVLEQWVNGKQIMPGTSIPFGTRIDLVIGEYVTGKQEVPNLIGLSWAEAKMMIDSLALTSNPIWEGSIKDSNTAIVFKQQPEALNELDFKNAMPEGDLIDVFIMQNPSQEILDMNQPGSNKLIGDEETDSIGQAMPSSDESPAIKKDIHDSLKKRKLIPGMQVRSVPVQDPKKGKNTLAGQNTKKGGSDVIGNKPKPKPKAKPKLKKPENTEPVKKNDNISEEFN